MDRRRFLTIAGIGGVLAALTSFKFLFTSFEDSAVHMIKRELSFLKLDEDGVRKFATDYAADKDRKYKLTMKGYAFFRIDADQSGKVHNMVSNYLLSTDFFQHHMDESRLIKYVGLYDPYMRPCAHPFSHVFAAEV